MRKIQAGGIVYFGIAKDEPKRFHNITGTKKSPLVEAGWTEEMCLEWCKRAGLLSPIYKTTKRGGCWFCHNQPISQLRILRRDYPEYWELMMEWDKISPIPFRLNGVSIHDFDTRFKMEDDGIISQDCKNFRWAMIKEELNL